MSINILIIRPTPSFKMGKNPNPINLGFPCQNRDGLVLMIPTDMGYFVMTMYFYGQTHLITMQTSYINIMVQDLIQSSKHR
jgi:hypothetical protein